MFPDPSPHRPAALPPWRAGHPGPARSPAGVGGPTKTLPVARGIGAPAAAKAGAPKTRPRQAKSPGRCNARGLLEEINGRDVSR